MAVAFDHHLHYTVTFILVSTQQQSSKTQKRYKRVYRLSTYEYVHDTQYILDRNQLEHVNKNDITKIPVNTKRTVQGNENTRDTMINDGKYETGIASIVKANNQIYVLIKSLISLMRF